MDIITVPNRYGPIYWYALVESEKFIFVWPSRFFLIKIRRALVPRSHFINNISLSLSLLILLGQIK